MTYCRHPPVVVLKLSLTNDFNLTEKNGDTLYLICLIPSYLRIQNNLFQHFNNIKKTVFINLEIFPQ